MNKKSFKDWGWIIGGSLISTILAIGFIWIVVTVSTEIEKSIKTIEQRGLKNIIEENYGKYWYGDSTERGNNGSR
jgi:hypothetical protein